MKLEAACSSATLRCNYQITWFQNAEDYNTYLHDCKTSSNHIHLFGVSFIINCYTNTQSEFFEHEIKDIPM
jgi:hypothetical protein